MHYGVDIANAIGTPVFAGASGEVIDSGPASGYGRWVRIRHSGDVVTVYGHVHESFVEVGQRVERGQRIAAIGNRGQSTGPHLHFQLEVSGEPVDPADFYEARAVPLVG
ncbi:M23 family metallopeptidase [Parasphingorhabdus pacifica]